MSNYPFWWSDSQKINHLEKELEKESIRAGLIQSDNVKYMAQIAEQNKLIAEYKNTFYYINTHLKTQVDVQKCDCESKANLMLSLEEKNVELTKKISDLEQVMIKDRDELKIERDEMKKREEKVKALETENAIHKDMKSESTSETNQVYYDFYYQYISKQACLTQRIEQLNKDQEIADEIISTQEKRLIEQDSQITELKKKKTEFDIGHAYFCDRVSELSDKLMSSETKNSEFESLLHAYKERNEELSENIKDLENKLYKAGQTEQTIQMNKPNKFRYYNAKWGIGYDNPQYLRNAITKTPTQYEFVWFMPVTHPCYDIRQLEVEEQRAEEETKRKITVRMQLPFWYGPDNAKALDNEKTLPNDYFDSYIVKEPEENENTQKENPEKSVLEGKRYFPPMVLEQKLMDLERKIISNIEEIRSEDQLLFDIEKEVIFTVLSHSINDEPESFEEKKSLELRCFDLSNQLFNFQKTLFLERQQTGKDKEKFKLEKESLVSENTVFSNRISDLENDFIKERKDFETKSEYFQNEISRLTGNLSHFSKEAMNDFSNKSSSSDSDVSSCKAFMGHTAFRSLTVDDQDDFESWDLESQFVKESPGLYFPTEEDKAFRKEYNEFLFPKSHVSLDSQSDCDSKNVGTDKGKTVCESPVLFDFSAKLPDHTEFLIKEEEPEKIILEGESSKSAEKISDNDYYFKSKSKQSLQKKKRKTKRKKHVKSPQTQNSKVHNSYLSGVSDRNLRTKTRLEWRIKESTHDVAQIKSSHVPLNVLNSKKDNFVSNVNNYDVANRRKLVVPYKVYSMRQLINLARDQICCASCGVDDFICKSDYNRWFYSYNYSHTSYRKPDAKSKPTNQKGPNWQWVPKTI